MSSAYTPVIHVLSALVSICNVFFFLTYLLTKPVRFLSCGDEVGMETTTRTVTGRGWGLRHTVRGGNGVKSLSLCHSLIDRSM